MAGRQPKAPERRTDERSPQDPGGSSVGLFSPANQAALQRLLEAAEHTRAAAAKAKAARKRATMTRRADP